MFNYNLYIIKAETRDFGTLFHKFTSKKEIKRYLNNPFILGHEVVKSFEGLSFDEFNELWFNKSAEEISAL